MVKLFRCEICGDPYVGESAPDNCPFCGAHKEYIKDVKEAKVNFDLELNDTDKANAEYALKVEISNAAFYACASKNSEDEYGRLLFKALAKVEAEHASIWKKILKLENIPTGDDTCSDTNSKNLEESHTRETKAIQFYGKAANEAENERIKNLFLALVEIEKDHLVFSENS
ncbi:MAG: ferritin [Candidatus Omnitrophica bacterium]|nr:ferritin [Candidatus Omnitrophota bacterium]MCF7877689.1 ferritin [Candidatus Omnitrophota bacterium]MCF7879048.1 ferritin [Candidatus Omnitrophota bacterium]